MILVVDAGNSRIKWAWLNDGHLVDHAGARYDRDIDALLDEHWLARPPPERVVYCSVAKSYVAEELSLWVNEVWSCDLERVRSRSKGWGVTSAYERPETLGADRFAALVAAHHEFEGPVVIVDSGTAITVDAIDAQGNHLGGVIMPGVMLMRRALMQNTARIGPDSGRADRVPARNTPDALAAGTLEAAACGIMSVVHACERELGGPARRVITGGETDLLQPRLEGDWAEVPDLVLRGLSVIADART